MNNKPIVRIRPNTLLLRAVPPVYYDSANNRIRPGAFRPTPKDEGKLTTQNGDWIKSETLWRKRKQFLEMVRPNSALPVGITAVPARLCIAMGIPVIPDGDETDPFHTALDYNAILDLDAREQAYIELAKEATKIGMLYIP